MTLSTPPHETSPSSPSSSGSGSVLREYISPTCKLQISANPSALEKWTRKPTLKNQRFLLSFEDPRLSEDQWVSLRGDRLKLAALTEAVTTYVQGFLSQSRSITPLENPTHLTETEPKTILQSPQGISLQPKGLLAHSLNLGTIATEATGESLSLTSTQLADLASVLDEHSTATLDLPVLNRDTAWMRSPTAWGKIAALSLLSVGITANVLNQFSPKKAPVQIASQASSSDQRLTPPQVPQSSPTPSVFISPGSNLPGQQIPPIGSTTPPIVADSNSNTNGAAPGTSNPDTGNKPDLGNKSDTKSNSTEKPATGGVEATGEAASKNGGTSQNRTASKPSMPVENVPKASQPQPSAPIAARKPSNLEATADRNDPEPPPAGESQLDMIQAKIPQRWFPPEKFSGELVYIVDVAPDGKVISRTPEGKASPAAEAILPAIGTPFVPSSSPYKIRVLFLPDGTRIVEKM